MVWVQLHRLVVQRRPGEPGRYGDPRRPAPTIAGQHHEQVHRHGEAVPDSRRRAQVAATLISADRSGRSRSGGR